MKTRSRPKKTLKKIKKKRKSFDDLEPRCNCLWYLSRLSILHAFIELQYDQVQCDLGSVCRRKPVPEARETWRNPGAQ